MAKEKILTKNIRFPIDNLPQGTVTTNAPIWMVDSEVFYDEETGEYTIRKLPAAGSPTQAVYIDELGQPQSISHSIGVDVPSDAVFTDHTVTLSDQTASSQELTYGDEFTAISSVSVDANGYLTEVTLTKYKIPESPISVTSAEPSVDSNIQL